MLNPIFSGYYNYDAKEENGKITFTLTPATPPEEQKAQPKKEKAAKTAGPESTWFPHKRHQNLNKNSTTEKAKCLLPNMQPAEKANYKPLDTALERESHEASKALL
jgi:hypothetical protein